MPNDDVLTAERPCLTTASIDALRRIGDGDLGEFAVAVAAIAFLLWKYSGNRLIVLRTPHFPEPLVIEIRPDEPIEEYLIRVADIIEENPFAEDAGGPSTVASVLDNRLDVVVPGFEPDPLLFHIRLSEGEIAVSDASPGLSETLAGIFPQFERFGEAVKDIDAVSSEDRRRFAAFNRTAAPRPESTVVEMFETQVARFPGATALVAGESVTAYAELNGKANRLARYLRDVYDIGPESVVGILLDRSELMIVAILGILKAGAAFVPADTAFPAGRIQYILNDAGVSVLITQSDLAYGLEFSRHVLPLDLDLPCPPEPARRPAADPRADHLAYVIYTSGSTGQPKGCLLEHGGLANYISWANDYYRAGNFGLYSSLCFDFTLTNIFCPLTSGHSLRIYPQSQSIETILRDAFRPASGIDTLKLTPSHVRLLEYMNLPPSAIRKAIVGGEELTPRHIAILRSIDPAIEIYNEYGPTEATVGCIVKRIDSDALPMLIGAPIANTRVHILDETDNPAPLGVRGEICIAGAGLARGYLRRPEITKERFIRNPFPGEDRIYRTGDIGRWLPDGQIQCFGRRDDQVKIRGYRIELGEIEALLCAQQGVDAAAVALREDENGVRRLSAYVKGTGSLTEAGLRAALASRLPDYMIPADICFLDEFPLNLNGKIDRAALPVSGRQPATNTGATPVQNELLSIWREIFDKPGIRVSDGFFALGGDSLLALQVISRLWNAFAVNVSIDDIFDLQTIEAIAALIEAAAPPAAESAPSAIPVRPRTLDLPLSFSQQRLWFLAQLEGPNPAYHLSTALRLEGELDIPRLESAITEITRRHEILRTTFPDSNGRPTQRIAPPAPFRLRILKVTGEREAATLAAGEATEPFDLAEGPLFRASLYRIRQHEHVLAIAMHHIVSDAWSSGVVTRELSALYASGSASALAIQYADYAAWQRERLESAEARRKLASLQAALAGAPDLLEIPTDRPRPANQTFNGSSVPFLLDDAVASRLRSAARESGATPFMILLAGFAVLLSRYSGQKDIVIGSPVANRPVPEVETLIGFFVNTLALRIDLTGDPAFGDLLARVKSVALESYACQEIPFEQVVDALQLERNLSRSPVFQAMFAYESAAENSLKLPGLVTTPLPVETHGAKFDLTLYVEDSGAAISGALEFNSDLFERATAARMSGHLRALLEAIAVAPDAPLSALSLLTPEERCRVTVEWNRTEAAYPDTPVHKLFEEQTERTPQAVAAVFANECLTYRDLNARANGLAQDLIARGVGPDTLVGVAMERSFEMVVALLAILKAGGAYVPIDPDYPPERVRFMLENSRIAWLLTQAHLEAGLPPGNPQKIVVDHRALAPAANPATSATPANLAYMIYTSGSTGRPKGALNAHRALTNRILWMQDAYRLTPADAVLQKTPFSFDVSVWEFFWPLVTGARLVLAKPGGQRESDYLIDLIAREGITTLHFVPSMLRAFLEEPDVARCTSLRRAICSGEALPYDLQQKFFERLPAELHNLYGPTEAAVDVTFWECRRNDTRRTVPIGRPISNTRIYIVDEAMQPCPVGIPGELLIGGTAVGRGYLGEPELTAAKFVPDPFAEAPGACLYRTGDLARFGADGAIEFLGRIDNQVKIRGFRIEPGEIEAQIRAWPEVSDCVVVAHKEGASPRLAAYLATAGCDVARLREFLKARLPGYMVPSFFVTLDHLPLLPNGKINRKALPPLREAAESITPREPAETSREELLAAIWRDVLQLPSVGIHDNFFELGGDSILSIQVVARARQAGLRISARQLFQRQTIHELAAAPEEETVARGTRIAPTGEAPLTAVQLWLLDRKPDAPERFNQLLLIEVPFDTDAARLADAVQRIYEHHDALRLRFPGGGAQVIDDAPVYRVFQVQEPSQLSQAACDAGAAIDIVRGPVIAVRLLRFPATQTARLLLVINHLAVDGVSWRIVLEDLHAAYHELPLPEKTTSFREWAFHLRDLAQTPEVAAEAPFWADLLTRGAPLLPTDFPCSPNLMGDTAAVSFRLEETETSALLRQTAQAWDARINEILLTALALAIQKVTGQSRLLLDLEGHGRHESGGIDLSRTVGWFTNISPVLLEIGALNSVKRQLRAIPHGGFHYPLLRYLTSGSGLASLPQPEILFNYHGQTDATLPRESDWLPAYEDLGPNHDPSARRTHLFEIIAVVAEGKLRVDWLYSSRIHLASTVENFATHFKEQLRALIHARLLAANPDSIEDTYGLSPLQQGLLFHALYERNPAAYFQQFSFVLEGALDEAALRQAWANAVQRHAVLRTAFVWEDLDRPLQVVFRSAGLPWETHDWRGGGTPQSFDDLLAQDRRRGLDLKKPPLFRCTLIREQDTRYRFLWSTHHILLDGWSAAMLMQEIFSDYVALARGNTVIERSGPPPYRHYIEWLASQSRSEAETFWRAELEGFRTPASIPEGPVPAEPVDQQEHSLLLDEHLTAQLGGYVRAHRLTLNVLLRGVWAILLSRYTSTPDVVFGVTVSGRPAALDGVESMVGLFINTVPVRVDVDPDRPVLDLLARIHTRQTEMEPHAWVSLVDIGQWSEVPAGASLLESLLVFENYPVAAPSGIDPHELQLRDLRAFDETNYPLTLTVVPGDRLLIRLAHDPARFSPDAVRRMLSHIETLLKRLPADPDRLCGDPILPDGERDTLLRLFNDTDVPFDPARTVVHRIEANPLARDFNARANRLARRLLRHTELSPDNLVAIVAPRSERMAEAILAVWKCGAAYVPVEPVFPAARIRAILKESKPKLILSESGILTGLGISDGEVAPAPVICLDVRDTTDGEDTDLNRIILPQSLAYVIFTSGSSGTPKGVMIEHAGMLNHLLAKIEALQIGSGSVVAQNASHCFDISVWQFFAAPLAGARTVILSDEVVGDPARFLAALESAGVTILEVVPSYLAALLERPESERAALARLDVLLVTGEPTSSALLGRWFRTFPQVPVVNAYGPTEASDDITHHRFVRAPETSSVPVGKPIRNLRIYVVDERMNLCPIGIRGEICVSGIGVGRGYLNDFARTEAAFLDDPFRAEPGTRMYRTGDIGAFLPDGTLFLFGRKDHQVKIRGHRIELSEVENALERLPEIARAIVSVQGDSLTAYLTYASGRAIPPEAIRRALAQQIPAYMAPQSFVTLDALPLTATGKVDRAALTRSVALPMPAKTTRLAPRTLAESTLLAIWEEVLDRTGIGIDDDYFDLGGHSILAVRLMAKIEQAFQRRLPIAQLFRNPTIQKLAASLGEEPEKATLGNGIVQIREGSDQPPLFLLPGAGGNVIYFHALARHLTPGRAVYGLEAPGVDGSRPPLTSVEQIAAHHIELLRPLAGPGPVFLAGHSFGASVALEMSRQLVGSGIPVGLLAIFDSSAPILISDPYWRCWGDTEWLLAICHEVGSFLGAGLDISRQDLDPLDPDARLVFIAERISRRGDWFQGVGPERLRAYLNVYRANCQAEYAPEPVRLDIPITLFRCTESGVRHLDPSPEVAALRQDPSWGWSRFSSRDVSVADVTGTHLTMMLEPHAGELAAKLQTFIDNAANR